jgi:hypothetical protein
LGGERVRVVSGTAAGRVGESSLTLFLGVGDGW